MIVPHTSPSTPASGGTAIPLCATALLPALVLACAPEATSGDTDEELPPPQPAQASPAPESAGGGVFKLTFAPRAEETGGLDEASLLLIEESLQSVDAAPEVPEYWTQLGMVYHAYRRFELARTCYEQRLLRDTAHPRTLYYSALVEEQLGRTSEAVELLNRCLAHDATYPPAFWQRGLLHLSLGELDRAANDMREALRLAPFDAAANVGLARVRLQQNRADDAVSLLEAHLRRLPGDSNARFLLGTAYRKAGRMEDAARMLTSGTGGDPVREDPWLGEIHSLRRGYRREFLDAVDVLTAGDVVTAIEALEALHAREPEDTLIHLSLHRAYRMNGERERALELLLEARDLEPLEDMGHFHLAGVQLEEAHSEQDPSSSAALERALESIDRTCELSPTFANAHGMRGDVLMAMKRYEEATDAYVKAAQLDRSSAMWNDKAARTLGQGNRWQEAIPFLLRLDGLRPGTANIHYLLSIAYLRSGRPDEALTHAQRVRQLSPDDPRIQDLLDSVGEATGKRP